ncbi:MAG: AEC family transporter, partial [Agathobacter sp.]
MTIISTMCKLLFAMVLGYLLFKKGILNQDTNKKISSLIVQVTCPCLIVSSMSSVEFGDPKLVIKLLVAGVAVYIMLPVLAFILTKLMKVPAHLRGTYMCMFIFANSMFMGYPVVQALFGDVAIFYCTIFNIPFNILYFSLALNLFKKDAAIESGTYQKEKINPKNFINMGIIASVVALVIYFARIPLPTLAYDCLGFIGNITTPLSMVIIGSSLAAVSLKEIKTEKGIWPMLPIRLAVIPVIVWLFMHLFTKDPMIIGICTVSAG